MSWPLFRNFLGAVPLIVWYGWGLSREVPAFMQSLPLLSAGTPGSLAFVFGVAAQASGILFTTFLIILLIIRDAPQRSVSGIVPYTAAMVGTFASATLFFLPVARWPLWFLALDALTIITGLVLAIWALSYLGKSFALLPSARHLVTSGPYRYVRHPLYLFEEIAMIGVMFQFELRLAIPIIVVHALAQLVRIHYEEQVLRETFPEYEAYAARTARLIPGVY